MTRPTMCVFLGPSVSLAEARKALDAYYLPPAAQGDVHRVACERPYAIGIIDGYFQRVPSVWHKEILWAMAQGIRVYGSASMGALRAAELAPFGMIGVGGVFEAFRSGELEDDDEVAIAHAAEEHGYRPSSEAMVNIRRTLQRAADEGVIARATQRELIAIAKRLHYAERGYPRVLCEGAARGLAAHELEALSAWLPTGAVNQKRADALAMLELMKAHTEARMPALEVSYSFEHTASWEAARNACPRARSDDLAPAVHAGRAAHESAVVEELRLTGDYGAVQRAAITRALALELARQVDRRIEGRALHETIADFRRARGLIDEQEFERWLEAQEIVNLAFFEQEGLVQLVCKRYEHDASRLLTDQLRATGDYARLLARALSKRQLLEHRTRGESASGPCDEAELIGWYFGDRLERPIPDDLSGYLQAIGVTSVAEFIAALQREYAYAQALAEGHLRSVPPV